MFEYKGTQHTAYIRTFSETPGQIIYWLFIEVFAFYINILVLIVIAIASRFDDDKEELHVIHSQLIYELQQKHGEEGCEQMDNIMIVDQNDK